MIKNNDIHNLTASDSEPDLFQRMCFVFSHTAIVTLYNERVKLLILFVLRFRSSEGYIIHKTSDSSPARQKDADSNQGSRLPAKNSVLLLFQREVVPTEVSRTNLISASKGRKWETPATVPPAPELGGNETPRVQDL